MGISGQNYIETILKKQLPVTIFLTYNIRLTGLIKGVDENGILLEHEGRMQFVFKHAISTVSAGNALREADFD